MGKDARSEATLLLVEDDGVLVRYVRQLLKERFTVTWAPTVADALAALTRRERPTAIVIDGRLPDGSGVSVVRHAHALHPDMPMLVMTGHPDDRVLANAAQSVGAEYAVKPEGSIVAFARRVLIKQHLPLEKLVRRTDAAAAAHGLSLCESEVLALAVAEVAVVDMPQILGVKHSTVKTHALHIRQKSGHTLLELAWSIRAASPLATTAPILST